MANFSLIGIYIVATVRGEPPKTAIVTKCWTSGFLSCTHLPIMAKFGVQVCTNDIFFFVEFRIDRYILSPMWSEKKTKVCGVWSNFQILRAPVPTSFHLSGPNLAWEGGTMAYCAISNFTLHITSPLWTKNRKFDQLRNVRDFCLTPLHRPRQI